MFAKERHDQIIELLQINGAVTASDLMERFDVSIETVRRDLLQLEKQGALQRVHGGAILPGAMTHISQLEQRLEENKEGKLELSKTAAGLVADGDIIYIDSGATARYFADALKATGKSMTVITHSQDVFELLQNTDNIELIVCAGRYMRRERAFYGHLTLQTLQQLHMEKAFLMPSAISLQGGACDFSPELLSIQKQVMLQCDKLYLLADSEKFERHGLYRLCPLDPGCTIVTDSGLGSHLRHLYAEKEIHIMIGKEKIL